MKRKMFRTTIAVVALAVQLAAPSGYAMMWQKPAQTFNRVTKRVMTQVHQSKFRNPLWWNWQRSITTFHGFTPYVPPYQNGFFRSARWSFGSTPGDQPSASGFKATDGSDLAAEVDSLESGQTTKEPGRLPLDVQDFEKIRTGGYVYVDKTKQLYNLASETGYTLNFLNRPRRFGKSLLISTLEALFQGREELFEGLWIGEEDRWDWGRKYPVIKLDMSKVAHRDSDELRASLQNKLTFVAQSYGVQLLEEAPLIDRFDQLISELCGKSDEDEVVVLIDEYDAPIVGHLGLGDDRLKAAQDNREILKDFYTILKARSGDLRFLLLAGVTKFSKTSLFSGLNSPVDVSLEDQHAALVGYTEDEIKSNFAPYLERMANESGKEENEILEEIQRWYNGYKFSQDGENIYNPISTLYAMKEGKFRPYWFRTGAPEFLMDVIKNQEKKRVLDVVGKEIAETDFSIFDIETVGTALEPLLVQTGYLTSKKSREDDELGDTYHTLDYPNYEIKSSFVRSLLDNYTGLNTTRQGKLLLGIKQTLLEGDLKGYFDRMQVAFTSLPGNQKHLVANYETYYHNLFYAHTALALPVEAEEPTALGRIDMTVRTDDRVYVFEFKLKARKTRKEEGKDLLPKDEAEELAQKGLGQIYKKRYYTKYLHEGKNVTLVGVGFYNGRIAAWKMEELNPEGEAIDQDSDVLGERL